MIKKSLFIGSYALIIILLLVAVYLEFISVGYLYFILIFAFLPIFISAVLELFHGSVGTEFFVSIASLVGFYSGEVQTTISILLIMLIAKVFEALIDEKTENAIDSLLRLIPHEATIEVTENQYKVVDIQRVVPAMIVVVKAGGAIPVDGRIIYGFASINESSLTGESLPCEKTVKDEVFAGSYVENGMIKILVEKSGENTFFSKMRASIESAQHSKARVSILASRIATFLVPIMLAFIALVWLFTRNSKLVVTLLVFGSPLELTVIIPLAILAGVIAAFRQGILVKGGSSLEALSSVNAFAFDKTGTLTQGNLEVVDILSLDQHYSARDILKLAAIGEKNSEHLIAKSVLSKAKQENIEIPDAEYFESMLGYGIKIKYLNKVYFLGSQKYAEYLGNNIFDSGRVDGLICLTPGFHTTFYLFSEDKVIGRICVLDQIRDNAEALLRGLEKYNIKRLCLLSGDNKRVVKAVAEELGFHDYCGGLLPLQKAQIIKNLQSEKFSLAMVGDGINDAPALKQSNVGIVFGAMGMEPAIEAGDIVLMSNDLNKILFVVGLSKKMMSIIKQNIIIGFMLIHVGGMILAFLGFLSPIQAALFHSSSDFLILLNSFRIIRFRDYIK